MAGLYSFELYTWLKVLFSPLFFNLLLHLQRSVMSVLSLGFPLALNPSLSHLVCQYSLPSKPTVSILFMFTASTSSTQKQLRKLCTADLWGLPRAVHVQWALSLSIFFGNFCAAPAFSQLLLSLASEAEWQEPGQSSGSWHNLYTQVSSRAHFQLAGLLMIANTWVTCPYVHELGFCKWFIFVWIP